MLNKSNVSKRLNRVVKALILATAWLPLISQASIVYSGPFNGYAFAGSAYAPSYNSQLSPLPSISYNNTDTYGTASASVSSYFSEAPSENGFTFVADLDVSVASSSTGSSSVNAGIYYGIYTFTTDTSVLVDLTSDTSFEHDSVGTPSSPPFGAIAAKFNICSGTTSCSMNHTPPTSFAVDNNGSYPLPDGLYGWAYSPFTVGPGTYSVWVSLNDGFIAPTNQSYSAHDVLTLDVDITPTVVPIPSAFALFGGALGTFGWLRRRAA
jgi:hypothetical protein